MRTMIFTVFAAVVISLSGCGGNSGSTSSQTRAGDDSPVIGLWDSSYYLFIEDSCGLLPEGQDSFIDEQEVILDGDTVVLFSAVLPTPVYEGELRGSDSFFANATLEGDLFGDGTFCFLIEDIAFNNTTEESAETLYHVQLGCSDGFYCNSAVRGVAERFIDSDDVDTEEDGETRTRIRFLKTL